VITSARCEVSFIVRFRLVIHFFNSHYPFKTENSAIWQKLLVDKRKFPVAHHASTVVESEKHRLSWFASNFFVSFVNHNPLLRVSFLIVSNQVSSRCVRDRTKSRHSSKSSKREVQLSEMGIFCISTRRHLLETITGLGDCTSALELPALSLPPKPTRPG